MRQASAVAGDARERGARTYVYLVSAVAALGGLLFGFDTAVINGAIIFLKRDFHLSDFQTEWAAGSLLLGCVIGAFAGGSLSDRWGRRKLLRAAAAIFVLSAIGAALPKNLAEFIAARILGGVAIGVVSALSPLYIAEISPPSIRGRLVTLNQLAIVTGILCAFFINWLLASLGPHSWRWMFFAASVPSLVFFFSLLAVPESPRWLIQQSRLKEALAILSRLCGDEQAPLQVEEIRKTIAEEQVYSLSALLRPPLRHPTMIAVTLAVLSQVTGINTIMYYGSVIFTEQVKSQGAFSALGANVIIGAVNFAGTILALLFIDRLGRKPLLMFSAGGMGISLTAIGFAFVVHPAPSSLILGLILSYVACFAVGLGPGSWLLMSELFPTRVRGRAMSIATLSLWVACLVVTLTFLSLVSLLGPSEAFWIYALLCAVAFFFVWKFTPETKGKTLEQIERLWVGRH